MNILNQKINLITNKISFVVILFFPLLYIIGAAALNSAIVILSLFFLVSLNKSQLKKLLTNNIFRIFLIFFLYLVITNLIINYNNYSLIKSLYYLKFLFFPFAIYFFLNNFNDTQKKIYYYFNILLILFVGFDALIQYFYGQNLFGFKSPMDDRLSGVFNQELVVGSFLYLIGVPACILFMNYEKLNFINKTLIFSLAILTIFVIIFSGERANLIMFFLFILLNIIFNESIRKKLIIFFLVFILSFLILINFSKDLKYRYWDHLYILTNLEQVVIVDENTITSSSKVSKSDAIDQNYRINLENLNKILISFKNTQWGSHWITAYNIFEDNPYLGSGFRSFRFECSNEKYSLIDSNSYHQRCSTHPHNIFFEILSETGIIGLFLFILIICNVFYNFYKKGLKNVHTYILLTIIITIVFPIKPSGALLSSWYGSILWYLFGIFFYKGKLKIL